MNKVTKSQLKAAISALKYMVEDAGMDIFTAIGQLHNHVKQDQEGMKRAKLAEAFGLAAEYLNPGDGTDGSRISGDRKFICHALGQLGDDGAISQETARAAVSIIEDRLDGLTTLTNWLIFRAAVHFDDITSDFAQEHRIAWCRELQRELSA